MSYIEEAIRRALTQNGVAAHIGEGERHLEGWVVEILSGAVDNSNRTFLASRLTKAGTVPLLVFRRQVLQEGDGFDHENSGRAFILSATPKASEGSTDLPPIALYFASSDPVVELTSTTMHLIPPRRKHAPVEIDVPPRRWRGVPA